LQPDGVYRATDDDLPPAARATMPADWSALFGADFLGRVRYRRTFQKPTGLDSGERVFLVVEGPRSGGRVELGREPLGTILEGAALRVDITERLEDHNTLEVEVDHPVLDETCNPLRTPTRSAPGGLVGEVRLEIDE
jgi:hypothetical protein